MPILTDKQLKRIKEHKYSRPTRLSYLEELLDGFWEWTVARVPLWWSPNVMTLVGLAATVLSSLVIFYFNSDGQHPVPPVIYVFSAIGIFAYQILDALDGKQARRTNNGSPLGELMDHGCDSISTVFLALAFSLTIGFGESPNMLFFVVFGAMFFFYLAHWQAYVSGAIRFGRLDAIELQYLIMVVYLFSALFGESLWSLKVSSLPFVTLRNAIFVVLCLGGAYNIFENFCVIFIRGGVGRNGSTVAGTSVLSPVVPIASTIVLAMSIYKKSRLLFVENMCLYVLTFGMVFVKATVNLMVAHMTKSALHYMDSVYIGPALLFMNQYFNFVFNEYFVLCLSWLYCVADVCYNSFLLVVEIANAMSICVFSSSLDRNSPSSKPLSSPMSTKH